MSQIKSFKSFCSFCRRDLSTIAFETYNTDLVICLTCKEILVDNPVNETSPIVLFDETPVLQSDARVLDYFEKELSLPLPPIAFRNFLTEDEVYGYLIEDNYVVGLGLDGASIDSLSAIILNLTNLKFLSLKNNDLTEIPSFINSLTNLEILDLTKNNLNSLPDLQKLEKLNHLVVKDNQIDSLPKLPKNLLTFNARWNRLKTIKNPLPVTLKRINFAQNRLQELPFHFRNLTQLEELNLYGNQLKNISDIFSDLTSLKILILRVNQIEILPQSFERLINLETLDVEENELEHELNLCNLVNLKFLNISKNKFKHIKNIEKCTELINLDVRDNMFTNLNLSGLEKLEVLDISYNNFSDLPVGLEKKILLTELIASGNNLQFIDKHVFDHLLNLIRISFAKNHLVNIPDLSNLPNLQELYLNENELGEIPLWLNKLKLRVITLDNNKFEINNKMKESDNVDTFKSLFD